MEKKKKNSIGMMTDISSLKKNLLDSKPDLNPIFSNKKISKKLHSNFCKSSRKLEIINSINSAEEDEESSQKLLEQLYREELNKFAELDKKKEKLKNIFLLEENANDLYNWNTLLNRKLPLEKRNEYNFNNNKKKFKSFNKKIAHLIDYNKGTNVLNKLSNEILLNFYKDILINKKLVPELSPRIKLKNKNNIHNLISSKRISFIDKESILKYLILIEKENPNFKDEDLKIANKRKTADVLIKSKINKKINIENSKNNSNNNINLIKEKNNKIKKDKKTKKKKGLILSLYDENNPDIIKFNREILSLSEKNTSALNSFYNSEEDNKEKKIHRNIFSASNLKTKNILDNDIKSEHNYKQNSKNYYNLSIDKIESNNIYLKSSVKGGNNKRNLNISKGINFLKPNKSSRSFFPRTMSALYAPHSNHKQLYFLNNKSYKKNMTYEDYEEKGFMQGFVKKYSTKVGNSIYDKINNIIKHKLMKKFNLKLKNNNKNFITMTINDKYKKMKEEAKNNKLIQTFLSENLRTSITKNTESDFKNSKEKITIKIDNNDSLNRKQKNFYSCSNNYVVDIKRKNKNKFLNEFGNNNYLNDLFKEIFYEDKSTQKDSTKKIKSIYSYNN